MIVDWSKKAYDKRWYKDDVLYLSADRYPQHMRKGIIETIKMVADLIRKNDRRRNTI